MPARSAPSLWPLPLLLLVGGASAAAALWLVDHRAAVPHSGQVLGWLMGLFALTCTCALLLWLQWRDRHNTANASQTHGLPTSPDPIYEGTVYGLVPGAVYVVRQPFTDHYQHTFQPGERLRFQERHFLPYHGGHTLVFPEASIYLQEEENSDLLSDFSRYVARVRRDQPE